MSIALKCHRSTSFENFIIRKHHLTGILLFIVRRALCKTELRHRRDKSPSIYRLL